MPPLPPVLPPVPPVPQLQSPSVAAVQPVGQQPSPATHALMALELQATLQFWALPVSWSSVQALPSSQLVGQELGGSQVSPESTTRLPQVAEQSASLAELHAAGQHASPPQHAVMGEVPHTTLQFWALPVV
jgi:hypothetical protein